MKTLISFKQACLLMLLFVTSSAMAQFVSLDGRQFKDGKGNDWYPMVMDIFLGIHYEPNPADTCCQLQTLPTVFWPAPAQHYGWHIGPEHNDAVGSAADLNKDFALIKNLGFNSIRITSGVRWNDSLSIFELETHWGVNGCYCPFYLPFNQPWNIPDTGQQQSNVDKYFSCLDTVISIAANNNLKVMLDIFLSGYFDSMETASLSYLSYYGAHFKNDTNVFSYCTFEEIGLNDPGSHSKQYVCNITSAWYDTLKQADPNHLISISGHETRDICDWDMGSMKMDFYQPHIYPEVGNKAIGYQNVDEGINRVNGILYWLSKNCPVPWLIGETGFRASDPYYSYGGFRPFGYPMDGNEADQLDFARESVENTHRYGGSGYSWFMYQDGWNNDSINDTICPDGHGILRQGLVPDPPFPTGNPSTPLFSFEKPVGNYFRYLQHPESVASQPSDTIPDNYYDPYGTKILNSSDTNRVSGLVVDKNGFLVEDAVVYAWNYIDSYLDDQGNEQHILKTVYTFSSNTQIENFAIEPFNWKFPIDENKKRLVKVWSSAVSANSPYCCVGTYGKFHINDPDTLTFRLNYNSLAKDITVASETFQANTFEQISAWNSISVSNSNFNGTLNNNGLIELTSRSVRLLDGTNILNGAEVAIQAEVVTPGCQNFTNLVQLKLPTLQFIGNETKNIQKLELLFRPSEQFNAEVFPNPCHNQLTIRSNKVDTEKVIILTDIIGNTIKTESYVSKELSINVCDYAKGIYLLKIVSGDSFVVRKIILN